MRVLSAAVLVASLTASSAFLAPVPAVSTTLQRASLGRGRATTEMKMMLDGFDLPSTLLAITKDNDVFVKNAGDYPWGSVQAPEWALPVAAVSILSVGVLLPLFLRSGVDAFNSGGDAAVVRRAATSPKVPVAAKAPVKPTPKAAPKPAPKAAPKPAPAKAPVKAAAPAAKPVTSAPKPLFAWQQKPASSSSAAPKAPAKPAPKAAPKPVAKAPAKAAAPASAAKPAAKKFLW